MTRTSPCVFPMAYPQHNGKVSAHFPAIMQCLFFCLGHRDLVCLATSGLVHVCLRLCSYLPTASFIGEHYTTDVLAGAAIGISMTWLANLPAIRKVLTTWALQGMDAKPGQFYCFSFILS